MNQKVKVYRYIGEEPCKEGAAWYFFVINNKGFLTNSRYFMEPIEEAIVEHVERTQCDDPRYGWAFYQEYEIP